jgi:hypothetical protein
MLLNAPYQGNVWWGLFAAFGTFLLVRVLLGFRRKRNAGEPVTVSEVIGASLVCLMFIGVAVYQILTHQRR